MASKRHVYRNLLKTINEKKDKISELQEKLDSSCKHSIKGAFYKPYLCLECAKKFVSFCKENNYNLDVCLYRDAIDSIAQDEKIKAEAESKKAYEAELERINKITKYMAYKENQWNNWLNIYKNKQNLSYDEIGKRYERYVGWYFEWVDMPRKKVTYRGILEGKNDLGVDLVVEPSYDKAILVQCKMWNQEKDMRYDILAKLHMARDLYRQQYPHKKEIKLMLIIQNDNLDEKSREICKRLRIEYNPNIKYNDEYPMVKCNLESKIYHLPDDPLYDKIHMHKSTRKYVATIKEAEALGCRRQEASMPNFMK
ncbi:hypothetical protein [Campylobacter corcagiensis]|uniref:Restriction endonuclease n=1 Tax=Campylobacter corcagiensis TaxID=1448857 RepID=A0A7M1LET2_9BACT|nr:hypothetical protein [Campylobacter corcagiensis]QKF65293.1 hypothetical protein CCORG_1451 [Campylobacter corcagiensis]QOQ86574.1 hypothetical protein IMC76_04905 [Campylobacter corcagiensis]